MPSCCLSRKKRGEERIGEERRRVKWDGCYSTQKCGRKGQPSSAQHSTAQLSTAQHSTAQHSTAQHSTAQHSTDVERRGRHLIVIAASLPRMLSAGLLEAFAAAALSCPPMHHRRDLQCALSEQQTEPLSAAVEGGLPSPEYN